MPAPFLTPLQVPNPEDLAVGQYSPADRGFLTWNFDGADTNQQFTLGTNGAMYGVKMKAHRSLSISNIYLWVNTVGATFTASRNWVGLYDANKNLLVQSADQATAWATLGLNTVSLGASYTVPKGFFYICVVATATTRPTFTRRQSNSQIINGLLAASDSWAFNTTTGVTTTLPATLGAFTANANEFWAAVA